MVLEVDGVDGAGVDVERVEQVVLVVEAESATERLRWKLHELGVLLQLFLAELAEIRVGRAGAVKLAALQFEGMQRRHPAAAGPPDVTLVAIQRETEPALPGPLPVE